MEILIRMLLGVAFAAATMMIYAIVGMLTIQFDGFNIWLWSALPFVATGAIVAGQFLSFRFLKNLM